MPRGDPRVSACCVAWTNERLRSLIVVEHRAQGPPGLPRLGRVIEHTIDHGAANGQVSGQSILVSNA